VTLKIKGYCPVCGHPDPEVGVDAWLRCTNPDCPNPEGIAEILLDNEIHHIVRFADDGVFNVKHPLRERIASELLDCHVHCVVQAALSADNYVYAHSDGRWEPAQGTWRLKFEPTWLEDPEFGGDPFSWERVEDATTMHPVGQEPTNCIPAAD
jgi:hypothetical protein